MSDVQTNQQQNPMNVPNWNMPTMNPMMGVWMHPWMMFGNQAQQGRPNNNPMMGNMNPVSAQQQNIQESTPNQESHQNVTNGRVVIPCGIVENVKEIRPADIPMDDGFGMFMRKDLEEIYIKQWGDDGKINTRRYIPVIEPTTDSSASLTAGEVLNYAKGRFEKIEGALSELTQAVNSLNPKKQSGNQRAMRKMEVEGDE